MDMPGADAALHGAWSAGPQRGAHAGRCRPAGEMLQGIGPVRKPIAPSPGGWADGRQARCGCHAARRTRPGPRADGVVIRSRLPYACKPAHVEDNYA